jgi:hypothetical protein
LLEQPPSRSTPIRETAASSHLPDPRAAQILRLKDDNAALRLRLAAKDREISELTAFKTTAVCRLTAQHIEIENLRAAFASHRKVTALTSAPEQGLTRTDEVSGRRKFRRPHAPRTQVV